MQRWSLTVMALSLVIAVVAVILLLAVAMYLPTFYEMAALITPVVVATATALTAIILALMPLFTGPLTRAAWIAEEKSKLMLLLMGRDNTITPILPRGAHESVLEFRLGGNTVYYYLHPQSVLVVPNSRARIALAHINNPSTIPPDTAIISYDIRFLKGYDHAAHYIYLEKFKEQRNILKQKYADLLRLAKEATMSDEAYNKNKDRILELALELGFEPKDVSIKTLPTLIQIAEYNLEVIEALEKANNGASVLAPPLEEAIMREPQKIKVLDINSNVRTITPADVEAILLTRSLPHTLKHFYDRALHIALQQQMSGFMGLNTKTLILIVLVFVALLIVLQLIGGGGGGLLP